MSGSGSHRTIPSVDPAMERAVAEVLEDAEKYSRTRRALRRSEAEVYVSEQLERARDGRRGSRGRWAAAGK